MKNAALWRRWKIAEVQAAAFLLTVLCRGQAPVPFVGSKGESHNAGCNWPFLPVVGKVLNPVKAAIDQ